jgi:hypothetical protein
VARLLALLLGGFGLGAYLGRRRRREPARVERSPAEELRARLAEARARPDEPEHAAAEDAAAPPSAPEPEAPALDARRAAVHDRARRAIDELS